MTPDEKIDLNLSTIAALNDAFAKDPDAMRALLCNIVPCNQALADDPNIICSENTVCENGGFDVGMLGVINGVMKAIDLPLIASKWSKADEQGQRKLLGFTTWNGSRRHDSGIKVIERATEKKQ